MELTTKPRMAFMKNPAGGNKIKVDGGFDYLIADGQFVGYTYRDETSPVHIIGVPTEELVAAIREFRPGRNIISPGVVLDKNMNPLDPYGGELEEDEEEEYEDE